MSIKILKLKLSVRVVYKYQIGWDCGYGKALIYNQCQCLETPQVKLVGEKCIEIVDLDNDTKLKSKISLSINALKNTFTEYKVDTNVDEVSGVYFVLTIYNDEFMLKKEKENVFLFKNGKNRWEINRSIKFDRLGEYFSSEPTDLFLTDVEKWENYDQDLSSVVISEDRNCGNGQPTGESCRCNEVPYFVQF